MPGIAYVATHLARRGWEVMKRDDESEPSPEQPSRFHLWGIVIFALTLVVYIVASICIQYTYGYIVLTLAAVEDPNPDIYVRIDDPPDYDTAAQNEDHDDGDRPHPKHVPITSSLRRTVAHIQARGGPWARFRGLLLYILMKIAMAFVASLLTSILGGTVYAQSASFFIAGLLLANVEMAWIHIVISEPSPRPFYRRIPGLKSWIKIAPAAALRYFTRDVAFGVPMVIAFATKLLQHGDAVKPIFIPPDQSLTRLMIGGFLLIGLFLILYLLVDVPGKVAFIRVAASMLPEEDEAIVPFDRSFGSQVTPEIVGGSGKIGIVGAWRSFDWGSRIRFVIIIVKIITMMMVLSAVMGSILSTEAHFLLPQALNPGGNPGAM